MPNKTVTIHSSEQVLKTKWFSVTKDNVTLPHGKTVDHYVIGFKEACSIVALNEDNEVLLIRQYRYPLKGFFWELPAGVVQPDESIEKAVLRELEEETGYTATSISPLIQKYYQLCSVANPMMSIFLARGLNTKAANPDSSELIAEVKFFPFRDIYKQVLDGKIKNAFTALGVLLAKEKLNSTTRI